MYKSFLRMTCCNVLFLTDFIFKRTVINLISDLWPSWLHCLCRIRTLHHVLFCTSVIKIKFYIPNEFICLFSSSIKSQLISPIEVQHIMYNFLEPVHLFIIKITLVLLEPKMISNQYRARSVCKYMRSDQALHCWIANHKVSSRYP